MKHGTGLNEPRQPIVIRKRNVSPVRDELVRETPVRTEAPRSLVPNEPKARVIEKPGVGEKSTVPVSEQRPELAPIQEKVRRMNEFQKQNLNSAQLAKVPVQSLVAQQPRAKVVVRVPLAPVRPVRPDPVVTQAHANLDLAVLSKLPMKLSKVIKGNEGKLTCMLEVGGVTYVVKAGGGYASMQDHLTNTDLIIRLDIPGVRSPIAKKITPDFVNALKGQLKSSDSSDKQLLDALGTFDQISKVAPGLTIQSIFEPENAALSGLLDTIRGQNSEGTVLALTDTLERALNAKATMDKVNGLPLIAGLKSPTTRANAISQLKTKLNISANKQILSVLENVSQLGADAVAQKMTSDIATLADAKTKLTDFAKSEDGGYALGGLAITDLLDGMDDRIVGSEFNGGNFMFDPAQNQFWCVDNSKDVKFALSAADATAWKDFARLAMTDYTGGADGGQTIEERMHWAIYTKQTQEMRELSQNVQLGAGDVISTQAGVESAVQETLNKMEALVNDTANGLPATERNKLRARLEFVKARRTFTDQLVFDPVFQIVPTATNPGVFKKLGRNLKGVLAGRPPDVTQAEEWKTQARNPNTSDQVLAGMDQNLTLLLQQPDFATPTHAISKLYSRQGPNVSGAPWLRKPLP